MDIFKTSVPQKLAQKDQNILLSLFNKNTAKLKLFVFSPKKHKSTVESKAESSKPCKISKFANHSTDENVVWINQNTEIDDALETNVDFPFKELHPTSVNPQQATVKDLDVIKDFESVTVRGLVLVGDNQPEIVPSKQNFKKLEACFVDESGTMPITIWNKHIEKVEDKRYYQIENVRLRQYLGQKYLSVSLQTTFTEISSSHFPNLSSEAVHEATRQFLGTAINCQSIQSVEIIVPITVVSHARRE